MRPMNNPFEKKLTEFRGWSLIGAYFRHECKFPERRLRTHEHLQNWLDSGLIEEVPFDPSFIPYMNMSEDTIKRFIWLKPTDMGMACHFIHMKYREEQEATKKAYYNGKVDALKALFGDMANSVGVDVEDLKFTDDDDDDE